MKLHLYEIVNMFGATQALSNMEELHPKIGYWVFKNTRAIREHYEFYEKRNIEICKKHLIKSSDGSYAKLLENGVYSPNYKDAKAKTGYEEDLKELSELEVEFEPYMLDYDAIMEDNPKNMPEPKYFIALDKLIK